MKREEYDTGFSYTYKISLSDLVKLYKKRLDMMRINHPDSAHKCYGHCAHNRLDYLRTQRDLPRSQRISP